ncbi:MAG TPA: carboxypeptidase regulatory-like domain-containing protein [Bryobacteraceae bacterium]|nr:carboxypeptidase regulatory-like domain-containing protein [Bryobacteraceae bacterium]
MTWRGYAWALRTNCSARMGACFLLPVLALAQTSGQIVGLVTDASSGVIAGATLTVTNNDTGMRRVARTGDSGVYTVSALRPGQYKVSIRKEGFQTTTRLGVRVTSGEAARVDFRLGVGAITESVTVWGDHDDLQRDSAAITSLLGADTIERLPLNGYTVQNLLDLSPGVLATPATAGDAGQFSANGQRPSSNYFTVDGVSANTGISGAGLPGQFAGGTLPGMTAIGSLHNLSSLEAVQEVRVHTSAFSAEYGRMPGAHIALVTRSGTNEFHGSGFVAGRHERTSSRDWFTSRYDAGRPASRLRQAGGAIGGPIQRDLTFFFGSFEALRLEQPYSWRTAVPSLQARKSAVAAYRPLLEAYPVPNGPELGLAQAERFVQTVRPADLQTASARVDRMLGSRGSLFFRYSDSPSNSEFGYLQVHRSQFSSRSFTAGLTSAIGTAASHELRVNVTESRVSSSWVTEAADGARPVSTAAILPDLQTCDCTAVGTGSGQLLLEQAGRNSQGQISISESAMLIRRRHQFRFGADYHRLSPRRDQSMASVFSSSPSVTDLLSGNVFVTYSQAQQASSMIEAASLFLQDSWRVGARTHINVGARWELTPAPKVTQPPLELHGASLATPYPAEFAWMRELNEEPTWALRMNRIAPRLGVARSFFDGRLVLRGSTGLFYDVSFASSVDPVNGAPYNAPRLLARTPAVPQATVLRFGYPSQLAAPATWIHQVSVDKSIRRTGVLSTAWTSSSGRDLLRREGYAARGSVIPTAVLPTNNGESSYNGLQSRYTQRFRSGMWASVAHTWSHSIDNGPWDSSLYFVQGPFSSQRDGASSDYDARHLVSAGVTWDLARNWAIDATGRTRSAFPVDVVSVENAYGIGADNMVRPDLVASRPLWVEHASVPGGRRLNREAFRAVPHGQAGSLGRNSIRGFGMSQLDLTLRKRWVLSDSASIQLRTEVFNAFNNVNFADPVRFLSSGLFGEPASLLNMMLGSGSPNSGLAPALQAGGPRTLQIGIRARF